MKSVLYSVFSCSLLLLQFSCGSSTKGPNRGAIVFGDSSTIVTETDPRYLSNNVTDIVPQKQALQTDTIKKDEPKESDTVKPIVAQPKAPESVKPVVVDGLIAPFEAFEIYINGLEARAGKKVNWQKYKGVSFTLENGNINGKVIAAKVGTITKVMQRTQTVVMFKASNGRQFRLTALPSDQSNWQSLKANNGKYTIAGVNSGDLKYAKKLTPNALKNAIQKWARSNRMSRKEEQKLLQSVRNIRYANQAPCSIALQSVIWKISGKDANGKVVERELRVDINL